MMARRERYRRLQYTPPPMIPDSDCWDTHTKSHCVKGIVAHSVADRPAMEGVLELIAAGSVPGGTRDNAAEHGRFTRLAEGVSRELRLLLSDAQTSGGLLIAIDPSNRALLQGALREAGCLSDVIGIVETGTGVSVE